ncbi:helix-turn-helix domain-containing protein [Chitinophaga solisilvae]|uniref:helix-turn-helix domain-containing protein n=1 Tax=Chitinophaga solisilvae TaxID=1233460 RepID=UPI00136CEB51|nr:AraC family transcriptional regulator [Chitinophaga solisilvae]
MEEKKVQTYNNGTITSTVWECDGIRMGHALSSFNECFTFPAHSDTDVIRMHFGLKGDYIFEYKQLNTTYDLNGGHHNIMYSHPFDIIIQNKTLSLETFGIQMPREMFIEFTQQATDQLKRFSENIINGKPCMLSEKWGPLETGIQQAIAQIIHCKYAGHFKKLFLLSKSIELLVLSAESCQAATSKENVFLKRKTDKEKIVAVRDLLIERLDSPPSLSEIARAVGLNEYKLKRGFKEEFNNTVFGYLTDQRLQLAHRYLRDTGKTAAEISAELGYSTPQHFNNAFKKKFGFTPFSVRNNP